ncbi:hypothetical protein HLH33_17200 [Gluconacetobacter diazotrophicus]|uniref:Uncharacterized protein n=1 Tax=Gluconacetobacter diazotrophicus TaxID=33996 RepID=A0A7W4NP93_GLUDI|nr:hypothetical protein [Gluconacetobacter diazotrophicus]MBB2158010.1 hypothetical protein [Gluconacetobacter diazotrophicus]
MTSDKQTTGLIAGYEMDATPFQIDPAETRPHTLIIAPTRRGLPCARMDDAKKGEGHE